MRRPARTSAGKRVEARLAEGRDYQIHVGVPLDAPRGWAVARVGGDGVFIGDTEVELERLRAVAIAYPSGELLEVVGPLETLPEGVAWLADAAPAKDVLDESSLAEGNRLVRVSHAPSAARPGQPDHYATTLRNISDERLRVLRFGGYAPQGEHRWRLANASGGWYTAAQFREWYDQRGEWLEPGQAVTDPNNYGGPPMMWAYQVEAEGGSRAVAGAVVEL
jgi:hypothetical protein